MHSKIIRQSAAVALYAIAVQSQTTATDAPLLDASDIEGVVPTDFLAPAEVRDIDLLVLSQAKL